MQCDYHSSSNSQQKNINVAVLGCGYWGRNLIRNFSELGNLVAVCDANPLAAEQLATQYHVKNMSWDAILNDATIQAVVIATPAAMHAEHATHALQAAKHVFVEKPLALNISDAERVCELAKMQNRRLMVGHLLQYHSAFQRLRRLVAEGVLGKIQYIYSNRLNLGKIRREEDILWSFAPHDISMILTLMNSEPSQVSAVGGYYLHKTIADVTTTHLTFPGGQQAHIFVSWLHPFKEQKLVVVGDKGMAVFDDGQPWETKLLFYPHMIEWRENIPFPEKKEAISIEIEKSEPLKEECRHFIECIASGATPRTDGEEGLRVLRVLDKATQSLDGGKMQGFQDVYIHESSYVDENVDIGAGTKIWHFSHISSKAQIGRNVIIGQNVMVGPEVKIADRCKIQNNVSLYTGVILEEGVFCGPSCVFTNVNTPRAEINRKAEFKITHVGRGATIGANATIVCGHKIGAYSFIAAGAVVTKDVPAYALVAGVPAKQIGWVSDAGERLGADLICPRTGQQYQVNALGLLEKILVEA